MYDNMNKLLRADFTPSALDNNTIWMQIASSAIIAVSFFIASFILFLVAIKRKESNYKTVAIFSGLFLLTTGSYFFIDVLGSWHRHIYFLDELLKTLAAVVTVFITAKLTQSFSAILNAPTRKEWEQLNNELKKQIEQLNEKDHTIEKIKEFEFLADSIPQIIWTAKPDGNTDYYNKHWYKYTGMTFEQTKDWGWTPVLHPDDVGNCLDLWHESLNTGNPCQVEYRFKKAEDGQYRWHLGRALPMKDENGKIIRWFGTCTDIHEYKLLEEELKIKNEALEQFNSQAIHEVHKNSQALNGILQSMPVVLYRLDKHGTITESKGAGLKVVGIKNHQNEGKNAFRLYPHMKNELEKMLLVQEMEIFTVNGMHEGKPWYIENYVFPDKLKNDGSIVVFALDVTEKKIAENKLKESEEKFQAIFDNTFQFIGLMEPDGKLLEVNKRALDFGGLDIDLIKGKPFWEVRKIARTEEGKENFREAIHQAAKGKFVRFETDMLGIDGEYIQIDFSVKPVFDAQGKVKWLIPEGRDITQIKTVEAELKKEKIKAVLANQSKSRFLANMSHEIRTPLNAILGFTEVLQKDELLPEQKKEYLSHITSSGSILLKLIGDVLDISKIEEGKLTIQKERFHLKEVVKSGVYPYKFKANENGLEFDLNFGKNLPDYVIGDPHRIMQIIINLIGNALKFTREGGITVLIENISEPGNKETALVEISVTDTGIGISKEKHESVFESFTQADDSIVKEYGGSGLGLSIVKQLVSLMGGEIKIKSPVAHHNKKGGDGTMFSFSLPLSIDNKEKNNTVTEALSSDQIVPFNPRIKVLLAEDNILNQKLANIVLTRLGCETDYANNGEEALEMLVQKDYDIILMDFQMPVMDGVQSTKIIREKLKYTLPIIGLSANVFQDDIEAALKAGMNENLGKPYGEKQIYRILKKWVVPAKDTTRLINLDYLIEVCGGDYNNVRDFLIIVLGHNEGFIMEMDKFVENKDYVNMNSTAHKYKSTAKILEAGIMQSLLSSLEKMSSEEVPIDAIRELYKTIKETSNKIAGELKEELVRLEHVLFENNR